MRVLLPMRYTEVNDEALINILPYIVAYVLVLLAKNSSLPKISSRNSSQSPNWLFAYVINMKNCFRHHMTRF